MGDLPDYTRAVDIVAQTITELAIDIAAQTLATLAVDIKAQTLEAIAVDIAAQTVEALGVNITGQDLAQIIIKIAAQTVAVYTARDWATTEDADKSLTGTSTTSVVEWNPIISYTPAAGKVLYIDDFDYYTKLWCYLKISIAGTTIWTTKTIAEGRGAITFSTPKKVEAGEALLVAWKLGGTDTYENIVNLGCREYNV